jgi:hypothetical protein
VSRCPRVAGQGGRFGEGVIVDDFDRLALRLLPVGYRPAGVLDLRERFAAAARGAAADAVKPYREALARGKELEDAVAAYVGWLGGMGDISRAEQAERWGRIVKAVEALRPELKAHSGGPTS